MKKLLLTLFVLFVMNNNVFPQPMNSFTVAFDSLHKKLSTYYAFTDWKKVNWGSLYSEFQPRIAAAESKNDSSAFLMALKEYTFRIPDGHIGLNTGFYAGANSASLKKKKTNWVKLEKNLRDLQIGGSYGFTLIKLDDGRFVVRLVITGSPASLAGINFGAEILEINDKAVTDAVNSTSVIWAEQIPATNETRQLHQCRLIGRAPVGTNMKIKFINRGDLIPSTKNLSAVYDNYITYDSTSMLPIKTPEISYKILQPSGYGYLEITSCIPPTSVITDFMSAIVSLISKNIKGLVLDLRINTGGQDFFAAAVAGCFYTDTTLYEYWSFYDPVTNTFQRSKDILDHLNFQTVSLYKPTKYPRGSIFIEPPSVSYKGPVVIMCSPRNVSSGEGIAMALQKLPQCKVVSFYGSHGSFGITAPEIELLSSQDSLYVSYPGGRSLDVYNKIQDDSDGKIGGVIPNIRPPLNDYTIDRMYLQGIDAELEYAVRELDNIVIANGIKNGNNQVPGCYSLSQNYPNPFNPTTSISYQIPVAGNVTLKIYDLLGREVATLVNEQKHTGSYEVKFNCRNLSSGMYLYQLRSGSFIETKKLILIK